jgi:hypothetical protein
MNMYFHTKDGKIATQKDISSGNTQSVRTPYQGNPTGGGLSQ